MITYNIGDFVCCDFCNSDGTDTKGGVLVGSSAICGKCCEQNGYYEENYKYKDEITEFFSMANTFRENVLDYRKRTTGTAEGKITIDKL